MRKSILLAFFLLAILGRNSSVAIAADPGPKVLATILPLHSIAASVTKGVSSPELLLSATISPHHYALRPDELRKITDAEVLVRVGPQFETFLNRPVKQLADRLAVFDALSWSEPHMETSRDAAKDDHEHLHAGPTDPHIWLDPLAAGEIARRLSRLMGDLDPSNAALYQANAKKFKARARDLSQDLNHRLTPYRAARFIVLHDAYTHFVGHFELSPPLSIRQVPEHQPGARDLQALRQFAAREDVSCLFTEPQASGALSESIAQDAGLNVDTLDPVGATLQPGPDAYFLLLENLADNLIACLDENHK